MEGLVSIIIPAYNAEKMIERCLSSIINQTYKSYEILVVNDGSTDRTLSILEHFKTVHSKYKIKIINIKNGGVSNARNIGLENARGQWICFVDSDDCLEADYLERLISAWKPSRWVLCHFYKIENGKKKNVNQLSGLKEKSEIVSLFLDSLISQPWNKLFEKSIIDENHIRFDTRLSLAEDFFFNMEYAEYCDNIFVIGIPLYNYFVIESGLNISQKTGKKYVPILVKQCERLYNFLKKWGGLNKELYQLDHHFIVQIWQYAKIMEVDLSKELYYNAVEKNMLANSVLFSMSALLYKKGYREIAIALVKLSKKVRTAFGVKYFEKVDRTK